MDCCIFPTTIHPDGNGTNVTYGSILFIYLNGIFSVSTRKGLSIDSCANLVTSLPFVLAGETSPNGNILLIQPCRKSSQDCTTGYHL